MNNEIRSQLLILLSYVKGKEENKKFNLDCLLESFERDINRKIEDLEYEKSKLLNNLELLNYVKEEINK